MWFVRLGGRVTGPFSEDRLRAMLRLNQFSSLHQVSRDKIKWESAAALIQQLNGSATPAGGMPVIVAGSVASGTNSTADKWQAAALARQAQRAAADAKLRQHPAAHPAAAQPVAGQPVAVSSTKVQNSRSSVSASATASVSDDNAASGSRVASVEVRQAGKSVLDRSTGGVRVLLHPVSLSLYQGELTALIGPSGCGKSTWLGLLTGRARPTTGSINVFGRDLNREFATVKRSLSAVPQMDAFLTSLTVRTSLFYSACLRLPANTPKSQLLGRVEEVLGDVGLDECGDRRISHLSGGQLRRLSLAQELLSNPDVLYLDEVTSGLDEESDASIMALLRELSQNGRTIMIITHTLHNLRKNCHKLVVMAKGGYLLFYGSPQAACDSFNVHNVPELLQVVKEMSPDDIKARCQDANDGTDWSAADNNAPPAAAVVKQPNRTFSDFSVLVRRQLAVLVSSPLSTLMSLFICVTIGVLLIMSYPDMTVPHKPKEYSKTRLMRMDAKEREEVEEEAKQYEKDIKKNTVESGNIVFILTISSFFIGCLAGTRELVMERRLFWRESGTEMSVWSYLASKFVVQCVLTSIQAACLSSAVVVVVHADCSPVAVAIANIAVGISGLCTGFFISAASRSEAVATKLMLLAVLPQMILSGGLHKDPPKIITLLSQLFITSHYAFQNQCGLFPEDISKNLYKPQYHTVIVLLISAVHSSIMLVATTYFLKKIAAGEDPLRGE